MLYLNAHFNGYRAGFMSNRGRQNVASYLALDLNLDWRSGGEHFESMLLDYDVSSNWGNWVAAAGLTGQRVNKFNISKQSRVGGCEACIFCQVEDSTQVHLSSLACVQGLGLTDTGALSRNLKVVHQLTNHQLTNISHPSVSQCQRSPASAMLALPVTHLELLMLQQPKAGPMASQAWRIEL